MQAGRYSAKLSDVLTALLLALGAPAPAQSCTLDSAVPASTREMARHPDPWLGRCVRLEGFVSWNRYFADVAGAYSYRAADSEDRGNDGWLGLYLPGPWVGTLRRGTVWGVLHDCGRDYDTAEANLGPNEIVFMTGFCHYQGGQVLRRAGFRPAGPASFHRQTDAAARFLFGDLVEASFDHGPPPEVVDLADRYLQAIRTGDEATLRELVAPWSELVEDASDEQEFQAFIRGERNSPVADLRRRPEPQRRYFREKESSRDHEFGYAARWHVCFCRGSDCAGRWPISADDASTLERRPYVCLRAINSRTMLSDPPDQLSLDRADNGFLEPGN